jgi:hypothetical protein
VQELPRSIYGEERSMTISHACLLALAVACLSNSAAAQFTSAVVPPPTRRQVDAAKTRAESVRREQAHLEGRMKT